MAWFNLGDRIFGTYLDKPVSGKIINIGFERMPHCQVYTVQLDEPVNVSKFESMTLNRRRLTVNLDEQGQSVDTKNRPDTIAKFGRVAA